MTNESTPFSQGIDRSLRLLRRRRLIRRESATEIAREIVRIHESEPDGPTAIQLRTALTQLLELRDQIREADTEIQRLIERDDDLDTEVDEAERIHQQLAAAIASIKANLEEAASINSVPQQAGDAAGTEAPAFSGNEYAEENSSRASHLRNGSNPMGYGSMRSQLADPAYDEAISGRDRALVPYYRPVRESELAPPMFEGDRLKFRSFLARFNSYVNRLHGITPLEKLIVLQKYLRGEPLDLISALELTDVNFDVALQVLHDNYASVNDEKFRLLREVQSLPRVTRPYALPALKKMIALVQSNVAALAANGIPLSQYAISLFTAISSALPPRMRQDFHDSREIDHRLAGNPDDGASQQLEDAQWPFPSAAEDPTVETNKLIAFVRKRVRQLEASKVAEATPAASKDVNLDRKSTRPTDNRQRPLVSTVAAGIAKSRPNAFTPKPCLFCAVKDHASSKCPADITITRRQEILRERKRCARCFRDIHQSPSECRGPRAPCVKCKSPDHYTSMHPGEPSAIKTSSAVVSSASSASNSLLWTMCAYVTNHGLRIPVRIFVDCGSSLTFLTPSLRAMLRETPVSVHDLNIQGYENFQTKKGVPLYRLRIAGPRGEQAIQVLAHESEFGVDPPNISPPHVRDALVRFDQSFPLADRSYVGEWAASPPAILLGMNQWNKFKINAAPKDIIGDIAAYPTKFGWLVGGDTEPNSSHRGSDVVVAHAVCCVASLSDPAKEVQTLWNLETIGIADEPSKDPHLSADDESAVQQFQAGLTYDNNRYTVRFPKRPSIEQLPNSRALAIQRLTRKIASLTRDPERYKRYDSELLKFVEDGFAKEIDPAEASSERTYHMPHHEVVNSSGKWRIVFDCSAKERGGTSLNDHLIQGPNLNPELITLLLKFRTDRVAISADIAKAYMMLAVHESDQPLFRFVWKGPGDNEMRTFQMTRVTWGASPSGFLLAATVREHFKRAGAAATHLGSYLYADDLG